jgi:hypothetical protein
MILRVQCSLLAAHHVDIAQIPCSLTAILAKTFQFLIHLYRALVRWMDDFDLRLYPTPEPKDSLVYSY